MAKKKFINKGQNSDLIGANFQNIASETVFSFGRFKLTTNFTGKQNIDYSNELSSFVKPITLDSINIDEELSTKIVNFTTNAQLNFDNTDLKSYVRFGSTRELLRVSIENIIQAYPGSLFIDNQLSNGAITVQNYSYNELTKISEFIIPTAYISNKFGLIFDYGNISIPNSNNLKNLNLSFEKYVIWRQNNPDDESHKILSFTGDSVGVPFIRLRVVGNPFPEITGVTSGGSISFHLKPEPVEYNKFKFNLNQLEQYFLNNRSDDRRGFIIKLKEPVLKESGQIVYNNKEYRWTTIDGYNVDIRAGSYQRFLEAILNLGQIYDETKTDLIARFLTPESLKLYDLTEDGKTTKLLRIYGNEFDQLKTFIDSLVTINKVSYDKKKNIPDQLVKNLAKTLGWNPVNLVDEKKLGDSFFNSEQEKKKDDLLPSEIDIELWRRILINTNYFWKGKGTRHSLKAMLLLIGMPEPFINITEYVYTVDGRINPNEVQLTLNDLPSATLPYDSFGYPIAPKETNDFYFQISGNTDSGQAYIDLYRNVGFDVNRVTDNKKSWMFSGSTQRIHESTPNYYQEDSRLLINTKEIDATLDIARGIEYDVYCYNKNVDDPITSSGVTKPHIYVNIPFEYGYSANTFTLPDTPLSGSAIQVNFNGITLTSGATGNGDYVKTNPQTVQLNTETALTYGSGLKDIITLTYLYDKLGTTGYTSVQYIVQTPTVTTNGTIIDLGTEPKGDVQLVVDGMTLTKGTTLFTGDFIIDPNDRTKIIVQNTSLQQYIYNNPNAIIRVWRINDGGIASNAEKKSEIHRVDSLSSSRIGYDAGTNRYYYIMDYKAFDVNSIKITLNGLTLQNETEFTLDTQNKSKIYFKANVNIQFGDIIGAYYVVDDGTYTPPLLPPDPDFPPIADMTFLEYLELITRRLINVKNRKTISDFKGGYYPTVLKIYEEYIKRSFRPEGNPLKSNGYTFEIIYPFIERYSSFFSVLIKDLLPATIIQRKAGVLIRNSAFTRQKFMYRRGVNFDGTIKYLGNNVFSGSTGNQTPLLYLGDNGSEFVKRISTNEFEWDGDYICVSGITS